jgi:hypothetical protein
VQQIAKITERAAGVLGFMIGRICWVRTSGRIRRIVPLNIGSGICESTPKSSGQTRRLGSVSSKSPNALNFTAKFAKPIFHLDPIEHA